MIHDLNFKLFASAEWITQALSIRRPFMVKQGRTTAAAPLAALLLLGAGGVAQAAPCAGLPSPVYVAGSTAVCPFIQEMGKALAGTNTIVYQKLSSCVGVDDILADGTPSGA